MQYEEVEFLHFNLKIEIPDYQDLIKHGKIISARLLFA